MSIGGSRAGAVGTNAKGTATTFDELLKKRYSLSSLKENTEKASIMQEDVQLVGLEGRQGGRQPSPTLYQKKSCPQMHI